ncbi:MAG TPA: hypothetical protein VLW49_01720 [Gaiellaceae bacterium]|nr:hypothetical protein [Gaiellaceae bacterium]
MSAVEVMRQEWYEGTRRLESLRDDPRRYARALEQLELVLDELRKRVGQTFTVAELAPAYAQAERWARELLEERATAAGWARDFAAVLAAAFHAYARGALDYEP